MKEKGPGQAMLLLYPSLYLFDLRCLQLRLKVSQHHSEVLVLLMMKGLTQQGDIPPQLGNQTGDIVSLCEMGCMIPTIETILGVSACQTWLYRYPRPEKGEDMQH